MATFGLDGVFIKALRDEFDASAIILDQASDFFALPQFDTIYRHNSAGLLELVTQRLKASQFGPQSPVVVEVPKHSRIRTRGISTVTPNYFRPGTVLWPEDRVLYHFLGKRAEPLIEKALDRKRVFSNRPAGGDKNGFVLASVQWEKLRDGLRKEVKKKDHKIVLKADISQYFLSINQHELVNQLEHQGYAPELARCLEKYLSGGTLDRSSRGLVQGVYGSDVLGNGYLLAVDNFLKKKGIVFFRYVDDYYIFLKGADDLRAIFPSLVRKMRDYDVGFNESKTYATDPFSLIKQETELDEMIEIAKDEAIENLTTYDEVEIELDYGEGSYFEMIEHPPEEEEVELSATYDVYNSLDQFQGEERDRAESFVLSTFRKASDPVALEYVSKRWALRPDRAREYAVYFNRFLSDPNALQLFEKTIADSKDDMIDFQWLWAALLFRRAKKIESTTLTMLATIQSDGHRHEAVRSLLTYAVCKHGSPDEKKEVRDSYPNVPLLIQLAIIHSSIYFTKAERNALLKTTSAHGDLQKVLAEAVKAEMAND